VRGTCAPFRLLPAAARVSDAATSFRLAPPARLALRLPDAFDARCVRSTSASPHSYYEHLRLVSSLVVMGLAPHAPPGWSVFHDIRPRFGGSVDFFCAGGVLFPAANRRDRTSDIPVALPLPRPRFRARLCSSRKPKTESSAAPVTGLQFLRSGMPSIDEWPPPRSERRFRPRTSKRSFLGPAAWPPRAVSRHCFALKHLRALRPCELRHAPFPRALGSVHAIGPSV